MIKPAILWGTLLSCLCNYGVALPVGPLLDCYDLENRSVPVHYLPAELREISGLAVTVNDTLLAHNDERTAIYEIEARTGRIIAAQTDFNRGLDIDYEGVTVARTAVIMVSSNGNFARTPYPLNQAPFEFWTSKLGRLCEIEGLARNTNDNTLVLACKKIAKSKSKREIRLLAISPGEQDAGPEEISVRVPKHHESGVKEFSGSGVVHYEPLDHYLVLSSKKPAIAELSATGELKTLMPLPKTLHRQPEGIAITSQGELIIANEGGKGPGYLVTYTPRENCAAVSEASNGSATLIP